MRKISKICILKVYANDGTLFSKQPIRWLIHIKEGFQAKAKPLAHTCLKYKPGFTIRLYIILSEEPYMPIVND